MGWVEEIEQKLAEGVGQAGFIFRGRERLYLFFDTNVPLEDDR